MQPGSSSIRGKCLRVFRIIALLQFLTRNTGSKVYFKRQSKSVLRFLTFPARKPVTRDCNKLLLFLIYVSHVTRKKFNLVFVSLKNAIFLPSTCHVDWEVCFRLLISRTGCRVALILKIWVPWTIWIWVKYFEFSATLVWYNKVSRGKKTALVHVDLVHVDPAHI